MSTSDFTPWVKVDLTQKFSLRLEVEAPNQVAAVWNAKRGVELFMISNYGDVLCRTLSRDDRWTEWQNLGMPDQWRQRTDLGQIAGGSDSDGRPLVFALGTTNNQFGCLMPDDAAPGGWVWRFANDGNFTYNHTNSLRMHRMGWRQLAVVTDGDGRLNAFVVDSNGRLYRHWPNDRPEGDWSWQDMNADCEEVAAACNADGNLEVVITGSRGEIHHRRQDGTGILNWTNWQRLDLGCRRIAAACSGDGRVAVFAVGGDAHLFTTRRKANDSNEWLPWQNLQGSCRQITAVCDGRGQLDVFTREDGVRRAAMHIREDASSPNGWSDWERLGDFTECSQIAAVPRTGGRLDAVVAKYGAGNTYEYTGGLYHASRPPQVPTAAVSLSKTPGWEPWRSLDGAWQEIAMGRDGGLEAFAIAPDNTLFHMRKDGSAAGGWSAPQPLSGRWKRVATGCYPEGDMAVVAIGTDGSLQHMWRGGNGVWSEWVSLGGSWSDVAVANHYDLRLGVFAIDSAGRLHRMAQRSSAPPSIGIQRDMGGQWKRLAAGLNRYQVLEIFAIGSDDRLYHRWYDSRLHKNLIMGWSDWQCLGGQWKEVAVGHDSHVNVEVFAVVVDGGLYQMCQRPTGWSDWRFLTSGVAKVAASPNDAGQLEVCVLTTDGALRQSREVNPMYHPYLPPPDYPKKRFPLSSWEDAPLRPTKGGPQRV